MSRRFSNLQYVSIGILFGTCVFLWTRKLNLTKTFDGGYATSNLRQTARSENEERLINSWANKIEFEESPSNFEDSEEIINGQEDNANDHVRSKEVAVSVKEAFSVNSPKASEEEEQVVDIDSSNATPDEPTVKQSTSPEPVDTASDAPTPTIENSEESSSISVGTSEALSLPVSTTTITTIVSP
ncbi:uncharacterized protein LOC116932768 [Daphnia magna]|uniref:Uncharacterized protein n=1 Tax=Daphnia magna TaxID=35525 RepID=A0A164WJD7_9CRUS|nr:uncharacterized protein LOC116932768 [Daphnia magna]KZS13313.1 Uncharacterized protein APZ42_021591 [Daphnia magna]